MPEIPMQAKFPGTCVTCFESIGKGDAIWYLTETKKAKHRACGEQKPKPAKKTAAKPSPLRKVKDKVETKTEGKAPAKPAFKRFTVTEIMKMLPALRAFDEEITKVGIDLQEMDQDKLAELFRIAKNANFKEDYPF